MQTYSSMIARPIGAGLLVLGTVTSAPVNGQPIGASHLTIPFLASTTRLADLSYEGGECDIDRPGNMMACEFQQVFFTTSNFAPQTCLVTTNRYARTFTKQGPLNEKAPEGNTRWISNGAPEGPCGVSEITTLLDGGTVRWTMETRKVVTRKDANPACRDVDERPETLSWENLRRPLPCAFIQPGGITR
jgi:hypothetical protein